MVAKLCSTMGNVLNKPFHAMLWGEGEEWDEDGSEECLDFFADLKRGIF